MWYSKGRTDSGQSDAFTGLYYNETDGTMDYEAFHRDFFSHSDEGSLGLNLLDFFQESRTQTLSFTQRLRFTYRNDFVEIDLGGRTRMSKSWYTVADGVFHG